MAADNQYDREKLYDEVWRTPMSHLAKQYGLSDQGLRKVCVKLQIPLPVRGHWAKVEAGKPPPTPTLPPLVQQMQQKSKKATAQQAHAVAPVVMDIDEKLQPIKWPKDLHPVLQRLRKCLDDKLEEARKLKERHDRPSSAKSRPTIRWDGILGSWESVINDGYFRKFTHRPFAVRVSIFQYERTLLILDAVCKAAERADFKPFLEAACERLELRMTGAKALVRISERFDTRLKPGINWQGKPDQIKYQIPTGRLRIHIQRQPYGDKVIADDKQQTIDQKIDLVLQAIIAAHRASVGWLAGLERDRIEREERERARQEAEAQMKQEKQQKKLAAENRDALLTEVKRWRQAESIRRYVADLDAKLQLAGLQATAAHSEWRSWALSVASFLDNSHRRLGLEPPLVTTSIERLVSAGIQLPGLPDLTD